MKHNFIRQSLLLAAKDLKIFFNDRGALLFALLFPFVFVVIFSFVMGDSMGGGDEVITVYVATAEQDQAGLSRLIIDALVEGEAGLNIQEANPDKAYTALENEQIGGYLFFPADFSQKFLAGEKTGITVYYNPEASSTSSALTAIARSITADLTARQVAYHAMYRLAGRHLPPGQSNPAPLPDPSAVSGTDAAFRPEVDLAYEKVGDIDPVGAADVLIPGYLTMFVFFALALTAETIIGEKENCTLERLVAAGSTRYSIIAGKYLGSFGRGLIQVAAFWIAGVLIFNVDMGRHPATVVLVSVLMALAASGIGVFLAAIARSRKGAASMGVFVSLSAAALGGSMWPLFVMPGWLQNIAKITPHAWANSAFNRLMLFGANPVDVIPEMLALTAFAVFFMALGIIKFKTE